MNTNSEINLSKCPACGSSNVEAQYVPEEDDHVIFFRCRTCGLGLPEGNINEIRDWWRKINILASPRDKIGCEIQKNDWISDGKKCYKVREPYFDNFKQCWCVDAITTSDYNTFFGFPTRDMILCPLNKAGEPILIGDEVYPEDDYDAPYKVTGYEEDALVKIEAMLPCHKDLKSLSLAGSLLYHKKSPYLLSCPFCGGQPKTDYVLSPKMLPVGASPKFYTRCTVCGISQVGYETIKDSVDAWNKRGEGK